MIRLNVLVVRKLQTNRDRMCTGSKGAVGGWHRFCPDSKEAARIWDIICTDSKGDAGRWDGLCAGRKKVACKQVELNS